MSLARLVLIIGAAARLVRLTATDDVTEPLRAWARHRVQFNRAQRAALAAGKPVPAPTRPWAARLRTWLVALSNCEWCLGVWWSFAVAFADRHCHQPGRPRRHAVFQVTTTALAAAHAVGLLAEREKPLPPVVLSQPPQPAPPTPAAVPNQRTEEGPQPT